MALSYHTNPPCLYSSDALSKLDVSFLHCACPAANISGTGVNIAYAACRFAADTPRTVGYCSIHGGAL